jgi:hypothetical protein
LKKITAKRKLKKKNLFIVGRYTTPVVTAEVANGPKATMQGLLVDSFTNLALHLFILMFEPEK